jgi:hypothetical protein
VADKDLNLIILRLVQCYKQQMIMAITWQQMFVMKAQSTDAANLQIAQSAAQPLVDRKFQQVEQRLQDGEDPKFALREFLLQLQREQ